MGQNAIVAFCLTRSPPLGRVRQKRRAPQLSKISANIPYVITGDLASNRDRVMRLYAGRARFAYFYAVYFGADRKQL